MTSKALEIWYFYILDLVLVLRYLSLQQMSKFPDLSGFWEFPKDSKVIPIHVQNSQELGKFPASNNTACRGGAGGGGHGQRGQKRELDFD